MVWQPAHLVRQPAHDRGERKHSGDVQRDGEADDDQGVACGGVAGVGAAGARDECLQVKRRHGHHAHHHGVGPDDGGQRQDRRPVTCRTARRPLLRVSLPSRRTGPGGRRPARGPADRPPAAAASPAAPGRAAGRGGARRSSRTVASSSPAAEITNGPAMGGRPSAWPTTAPGWIRLGPATAPIVMAQTTADSDRPRCSASARSTAANRACRLAAVPTPTPAAPSSQEDKNPGHHGHRRSARRPRGLPQDPWPGPPGGPGVRPARPGAAPPGRQRGSSSVATDRPMRSEPDRSTASREPMETVAPVPMPLRSWAAPRSTTVRRCTCALVRLRPGSGSHPPSIVRTAAAAGTGLKPATPATE